MRTLSAELTAAQRAKAYTPYMEVEFLARDRAENITYKTSDTPNRILSIRTAEGMYGGELSQTIMPNGTQLGISAVITLLNSDQHFSSKDFRGYTTWVKWGFSSYINDAGATVAISGTKTSVGEPYFVLTQKNRSSPGEMVTEFECISAWAMLNLQKVLGDSFGPLYKSSGDELRQVFIDSLTKKPTFVFHYDASTTTYTDREPEVNDRSTVVTMQMEPGDIIYIGVKGGTEFLSRTELFDRITIEQPGAVYNRSTTDFKYEYYSDDTSDWEELVDLEDNTNSFRNNSDSDSSSPTLGVPKVISFTRPADWKKYTVNGIADAFWVRIRQNITGGSAATAHPQIKRIGVNMYWGFQVDDSDAKENTATLGPQYSQPHGATRSQTIRDLLSRTQSGLVMKEKYFSLSSFAITSIPIDYVFDIDGDHTFFVNTVEKSLVIPNRIIVSRLEDDVAGVKTLFINESFNEASVNEIGSVIEIDLDPTIDSNNEAGVKASLTLNRYIQETFQGELVAPININIEPWDYISTVDDRLNFTNNGRVDRIIRHYDQSSGVYRVLFALGRIPSPSISDLSSITPPTPDQFVPPVISSDPGVISGVSNPSSSSSGFNFGLGRLPFTEVEPPTPSGEPPLTQKDFAAWNADQASIEIRNSWKNEVPPTEKVVPSSIVPTTISPVDIESSQPENWGVSTSPVPGSVSSPDIVHGASVVSRVDSQISGETSQSQIKITGQLQPSPRQDSGFFDYSPHDAFLFGPPVTAGLPNVGMEQLIPIEESFPSTTPPPSSDSSLNALEIVATNRANTILTGTSEFPGRQDGLGPMDFYGPPGPEWPQGFPLGQRQEFNNVLNKTSPALTNFFQPLRLGPTSSYGAKENYFIADYLYIRDSEGADYKNVILYQDSGKILIDGQNARSGTNTVNILELDLGSSGVVNPTDTGVDLGTAAKWFGDGYIDHLHPDEITVRNAAEITINSPVVITGNLDPTGTDKDLGDTTRYWDEIWGDNLRIQDIEDRTGGTVSIKSHFTPNTPDARNLGDGTNYFQYAFVKEVHTNALEAIGAGTSISLKDDLLPVATNTKDLGGASNLFAESHVNTSIVYLQLDISAISGTLPSIKINSTGDTHTFDPTNDDPAGAIKIVEDTSVYYIPFYTLDGVFTP